MKKLRRAVYKAIDFVAEHVVEWFTVLLNRRTAVIVAILLGLWVMYLTLIQGYQLENWPSWGLFGNSLWEWMDLFIIPIVLAIGGYFLQRSERDSDREIAEQTRLDKTLDDYLSSMKELIVKDHLLISKDEDPLRDLASTLAQTTIRRLDGKRNRTVFRFLWGVQAINETNPIISFENADLQGFDLEGVDLYTANLAHANLAGANLHSARLTRANLKDATLTNADLRNSDLEGANLENSELTGANMLGANVPGANLRGVTWPDGSLLRAWGGRDYIEQYDYHLKFSWPEEWEKVSKEKGEKENRK